MTGMRNQAQRRSKKTRGLLLAVGVFFASKAALQPSNALGDPEQRRTVRETAAESGQKKGGADKAAKSSLRMEEVEIYGDVEKPKTMFVIPRTPFRYSRKDQEKDFTREILDPMTKERLEDTERWRGAVPSP
jgi:hypothetical protein